VAAFEERAAEERLRSSSISEGERELEGNAADIKKWGFEA